MCKKIVNVQLCMYILHIKIHHHLNNERIKQLKFSCDCYLRAIKINALLLNIVYYSYTLIVFFFSIIQISFKLWIFIQSGSNISFETMRMFFKSSLKIWGCSSRKKLKHYCFSFFRQPGEIMFSIFLCGSCERAPALWGMWRNL